jgi:hypothetical protein
MQRPFAAILLVILASIPLLAACNAAAPAPATTIPAASIATTAPTVPSVATTPAATTAARPSAGTPTAFATAFGTSTRMAVGDPPTPPRTTTTTTRTAQGPRYPLLLGEAVTIPASDLTIRFKGISNDSRCPVSPMVVCAW